MNCLWRATPFSPPRKVNIRAIFPVQPRRHIADQRPFEPGDVVVLRQKNDRSASAILTRPLRPGKRIENHKGILEHDDILGKRVRDLVRTAPLRSGKPGSEYRVHEVRLDEYITMCRRLVTPIYPHDANLIASLFDLHPETPDSVENSPTSSPKLEILEAGTGHGALTLYLSRAIHAANPGFPSKDSDDKETMIQWKANRRAMIHSIEISAKYSAHAKGVVEGFRRGMYARNVDFHVGNVGGWIAEERSKRGEEPFLSHAFLDLPNANVQLAGVASALRTDGCLIVFNPSITQITECIGKIRDERIPLELERVIELGVNAASGGREWDVRAVKPRAMQKASASQSNEDAVVDTDETAEDHVEHDRIAGLVEGQTPDQPEALSAVSKDNEGWSMVCRPKVGEKIIGGGFLGVWRKSRDSTNYSV